MKYFFLYLSFFICTHLFSQNPFETKRWNAGQIIGLIDFTSDLKTDSIRLDSLDEFNAYGNITEFKNGAFYSGNRGPCGNECRITVNGTYEITENKIAFFINTISYAKDCVSTPTKKVNKSLGTFYWSINNSQILLVKDMTH